MDAPPRTSDLLSNRGSARSPIPDSEGFSAFSASSVRMVSTLGGSSAPRTRRLHVTLVNWRRAGAAASVEDGGELRRIMHGLVNAAKDDELRSTTHS